MSDEYEYYDEEESTYDDLDYFSDSMFEDPPSEADPLPKPRIPYTQSMMHLPVDPILETLESQFPPPEPYPTEPNILFSRSIPQTRDYIKGCLGLTTQTLKASHASGFIIMRLEDFCLIRNETRGERQVPHVFIHHVDDTFLLRHPDLREFAHVLLAK